MHTQFPFKPSSKSEIPLTLLDATTAPDWIKAQPESVQTWLSQHGFVGKPNKACTYQDENGTLAAVACVKDLVNPYAFAFLCNALPKGDYKLAEDTDPAAARAAALGIALESYEFIRYKKSGKPHIFLVMEPAQEVMVQLQSIYLVRDLVNTPTCDMGPADLAAAAENLADEFDADYRVIVGEDLLEENYPAIHLVGKAAEQAPRLIDFSWGDSNHPKLTLVGKGVCFDTGGLNIKSGAGMKIMKKDMGGAAHVLGLARLIMAHQLPVRLRVLIGAVENSISSNSMRPMDVVKTRKGLTIEIGHTDAEGRVVMSDCLTEAAAEDPELIIDFATLTGAARVGLGTEVGVFMTNNSDYHGKLIAASEATHDPIWPLPLHESYRRFVDGKTADLSNEPQSKYGGAIHAGLFLREFIKPEIDWIHFDIMAYNSLTLPGRPKGGEAQGMTAVFHMLQGMYSG